MEHWVMNNQMIVGAAMGVILFLVGWVLPNDKIISLGMKFSALLARLFGKDAEKKIEDIVGKFVEGMKKD